MALINKPLLTIAIPTYNRANLLKLTILRIVEAIKGFEEYVEIVISNNCSEDNTEEVIKEFQKVCLIKYFKNSENIGFNYNYIKIIDEYANGRYCWILGDDDFLYPNAVKEIINVIKKHQDISFINLRFDFNTLEKLSVEYDSTYLRNNSLSIPIKGRVLTFNQLISLEGVPGDLMFTFISSVIFKSDLMHAVDKKKIGNESWNTYYNCFPHSFFYASIMKDKNAYVFDHPLITAVVHNKAWDFQLPLLYLKFIPELYDHYLKSGFDKKDLRKRKKLIIRAGLPYLFLNSNKSSNSLKLIYLSRYMLDATFYITLFNLTRTKILKYLTKKSN